MARPRTRVCCNCKWNHGGVCFALPPQFSGGLQVRPDVDDKDFCSLFTKVTTKAAPTEEKADTEYRRVVTYFCDEFERAHGVRPVVDTKDYMAAQRLLSQVERSELRAYIDRFISSPPRWHKEKGLLSFCHIPSAIKVYVSEDVKKNAEPERVTIKGVQSFIEGQGSESGNERWGDYVAYVMNSFNLIPFVEWLRLNG